MKLDTSSQLPLTAMVTGASSVATSKASHPAMAAMAGRWRHILLGAAIVATLTLIYTLLYWNRFLSPSTAGTSFYAAEQMLKGKMPYRDFLFLTPPLHAVKIAVLIHFFGDRLVLPRFEAMIERVILALIVYFWLVRFFRVPSVVLGAFFGILVFSGDAVDPLASYHHDSVFWAVAAGFCASLSLDQRSGRGRSVLAAASGLFAGLCFATKQTTGLGVLAAIPTLMALIFLSYSKWRQAARFTVCFLSGWLVPIGALLLWLYRGGALPQFFRSVFMTNGSKGNLYAVLSRPFNQLPGLFTEVAIVTVILAYLVTRFRDRGKPESPRRTIFFSIALGIALILAVASVYSATVWPGSLPMHEPLFRHDMPAPPTISLILTLLHWGTLLLPISGSALILFYLPVWNLGRLPAREAQLWLFAGISLAVAYMLSLSWQTYCPMALPGLALIVTATIDRLEASWAPVAYAVGVCFCFLAYGYVGVKLVRPYMWMDWGEGPVRIATHASKLPKLKGLRLSEPTLSYTEKVTDLIVSHSLPSDTILVYPYFPIFYVLTDRRPPTYVFNHYLDVCPDAVCMADTSVLRANPPAVIVYMKEDLEELEHDEKIFRTGQQSGSRKIALAIEELVAKYHILYTFRVPASYRFITVYSRN